MPMSSAPLLPDHHYLQILQQHFGAWHWDSRQHRLHCCPLWLRRLTDIPLPPALGLRTLLRLLHPQDRPLLYQRWRGRHEDFWCELRLLQQNGSYRWIRLQARRLQAGAQGAVQLVGLSSDIHPQRQAEEQIYDLCQQLQQSEALYRALMQHSSDAIFIFDESGQGLTTCNQRASDLSGYSTEELQRLQRDQLIIGSAEEPDRCANGLHRDLQLRCRDGRLLPVDVSCSRVPLGAHSLLQCVLHDISSRKATEDQLRHLAHHDPLTGLPNRLLLRDRLEQALRKANRNGSQVVLCNLDVDRFKQINDRFGHDAGDCVLCEVARRLRACVRASDTVARLGGDEFVALLQDIDPHTPFDSITDKLIAQLRQPFTLPCLQNSISCSIGISIYPRTSQTIDQLLNHADCAMYQAKQQGLDLQIFSPKPR